VTEKSSTGGSRTAATRDRPRTEQAIRDAAESLFAELGYERATIRRIAERASVNPSLVIQYFGSKAKLFETVVSIQQPVLAAFEAGDELGRSVAEIFIPLYDSSRPWVQAALGLFRSAPTQPEAAELLRTSISEKSIRTFAAELDSEDPQTRSAVICALIIGVIYGRHLLGIDPLDTDDLPRLVHYCSAAISGVLDAEPYRSSEAT
jgi:AcrR family transcriptional regulator